VDWLSLIAGKKLQGSRGKAWSGVRRSGEEERRKEKEAEGRQFGRSKLEKETAESFRIVSVEALACGNQVERKRKKIRKNQN